MSYYGRLMDANLAYSESVKLHRVPNHPHCSDDRGWVTHRVVVTDGPREVGHITLSHIPRDVYEETLADRATFCRLIQGMSSPTPEDLRRAAPRHRKFEQFHVGSAHVAYVHVDEAFRRRRLAWHLYLEAAIWMGEQGLVLAASDVQRPEVRLLWEALKKDPKVPTTEMYDGRPALDYASRNGR